MDEKTWAEASLAHDIRSIFAESKRAIGRYIEIAPDKDPDIRDESVFDYRIDCALIDIDSVLIKAAGKHALFNAGELIPSLNVMHAAVRLLCLKTLQSPATGIFDTFLFGMHRTGVDYLEKIAEEIDNPERFAMKYKKLLAVKTSVQETQAGYTVCVYILDVGRKLKSRIPGAKPKKKSA